MAEAAPGDPDHACQLYYTTVIPHASPSFLCWLAYSYKELLPFTFFLRGDRIVRATNSPSPFPPWFSFMLLAIYW